MDIHEGGTSDANHIGGVMTSDINAGTVSTLPVKLYHPLE